MFEDDEEKGERRQRAEQVKNLCRVLILQQQKGAIYF
jgi:uncharacterized membrane protein affecting hemolysin expression